MATLTDDLASQLQGVPVQQVARQLGIDPSQAASAVSTALPLLMGALGRNASQPPPTATAIRTSPPSKGQNSRAAPCEAKYRASPKPKNP